MSGPLFLGLDAGGTSCRARLTDASGLVFGEGHAGPASARLGVEASFESMLAAAREAWRAAGLGAFDFARLHVGAGIAGIERVGMRESFAERPHPFAGFTLSNDGAIACLGAHGGADGGIVVAGTGSIAFGLRGERSLRFGGYGFPGSDEGSGARLGLAAVEAAFRASDGRLGPSLLTDALLARFDGAPLGLTKWCDGASATDYAGLVPLVIEAAGEGDRLSIALLQDAAQAIGDLVDTLRDAGCERVSLTGGLARPLRPYLPEGLADTLDEALGDPLDGALILAGLPPVEAVED
ncbi:BadF/BadG/BcrA/BcrD ATPase family protein [Aureimonas sp. ME7]|uniref:BadF/BadG/BcrA/BcrD ATPase family protein n=1 Tax=Aureimonas sp. ME7 TaxID=2744252 RepID=UPI0015F65BDD|nr:BadF/BadG/BcrA/BcrD ATPase family protein [Aureimonas sp. ME7]